jgi:hypothetical protein
VATRLRTDVVVAGLVVVTTVLFLGVIWTDGPAKRPTAYANANAAVAVQVIGLAGLAMLGSTAFTGGPLAHRGGCRRGHLGQRLEGRFRSWPCPCSGAIALMAWRPCGAAGGPCSRP